MQSDNREPWIIVYAADDNYAMQMGVSIISLCENNSHDMVIYVESDGISRTNKEKLQSIAGKYGKQMIIEELPDLYELVKTELYLGSWSKSTYVRMLLPVLIKENYGRVLWIDCDTCVVGDLSYLFEVDMADYAAMAVIDGSAIYKLYHGFRKEEPYFNAGILLINLPFWREHAVYELFLKEICRRKGKTIDVDQSYINCILFGQIGILPIEYNFMASYAMGTTEYNKFIKTYRFRNNEIYTQQEIVQAQKNVKIIHYTGHDYARPWTYEGIYENAVWNKYNALSPWNEYEKIHTRVWHYPKWKRLLNHFIVSVAPLRLAYIHYKYGFTVRRYGRFD